MKLFKLLFVFSGMLLLLPVQSEEPRALTAKIRTQGGGLNIRHINRNGSVGEVRDSVANGALVKIDPTYLAQMLVRMWQRDPSARDNFLKQDSCKDLNSSLALLTSKKELAGESFNYVQIEYTNQGKKQKGFASLEYLQGIEFDCKDLFKAMTLALHTTLDCQSECVIKKEESLGLTQAWSNILEAMAREAKNDNLQDQSNYLKNALAKLCGETPPLTVKDTPTPSNPTPQVAKPEVAPKPKGVTPPVAEVANFQCSDLGRSEKRIPPAPFNMQEIRSTINESYIKNSKSGDIERLRIFAGRKEMNHVFTSFKPNIEIVCGNLPAADWTPCLEQIMGSFLRIVQCHPGDKLPAEGNRAIFTSFLRNPQLAEMTLIPHLVENPTAAMLACRKNGALFRSEREQISCVEKLLSKNEREKFQSRQTLRNDYGVTVLAPGLSFGSDTRTSSISLEGLNRLIASYKKLKKVGDGLSAQDTKDYSHLWGSGGFIARTENLTVDGQFGAVSSSNPLVMEMVMDPTIAAHKNGKTSAAKGVDEVAERIAHESFHAKDFLDGNMTHRCGSWSNQPNNNGSSQRLIQQICGVDSDVSKLYDCRNNKNKRQLFSFRNDSDYPAYNTYEFYGSMVNVWVRSQIKPDYKTTYHCQNETTRQLWQEMEMQLLGRTHLTCK